jgi:hypothetical protein
MLVKEQNDKGEMLVQFLVQKPMHFIENVVVYKRMCVCSTVIVRKTTNVSSLKPKIYRLYGIMIS